MPKTARFTHPKVVFYEALHRLMSTPAARRSRIVSLLLVAVSSVTQSAVLEEVVVSGTVDPRASELVTGQGTRSVTRQEQISLALSPADLMVAIPGVAASPRRIVPKLQPTGLWPFPNPHGGVGCTDHHRPSRGQLVILFTAGVY